MISLQNFWYYHEFSIVKNGEFLEVVIYVSVMSLFAELICFMLDVDLEFTGFVLVSDEGMTCLIERVCSCFFCRGG